MGLRTWIRKKFNIKFNKYKNNTLDIKNQIEQRGYIIYGNIFIADESVKIGKYTYFNDAAHIYSKVCIGRYCSIAKDVIIAPPEHQKNWLSTHPFQNCKDWMYFFNINTIKYSHAKKTTIKNDVWIGARAIIKSGVTIGNGAIVGSGAIVTKDVPDYAIAAGCPAIVIGYRFNKDIIDRLLILKWWELPIENLSKITFNDIEKAIEEIKKIKSI